MKPLIISLLEWAYFEVSNLYKNSPDHNFTNLMHLFRTSLPLVELTEPNSLTIKKKHKLLLVNDSCLRGSAILTGTLILMV